MTFFFTADTHFRHQNIIKYDGRPYTSSDEMTEALIENWNSKVQAKDTVYHLGDWDRCHYGTWHLYGHSHGRLPAEDGRFCFDIGVNSWNYHPLSLDEVRLEMEKRGWQRPIKAPTVGSD